MTVAIDKKVVLAANYSGDFIDAWTVADDWNDRAPGSRTRTGYDGIYPIGNNYLVGSGWITLERGKEYEFDALAGEGAGGGFCAYLMIEIQGEDYPANEWALPRSRYLQPKSSAGTWKTRY